MTPSEKLRFNSLRKQLGSAHSSIVMLQADNDRKTREADQLRGIIRSIRKIADVPVSQPHND